jgi:hypothetical protein
MARIGHRGAVWVKLISETVGELGLLWLTFGLLDGIRASTFVATSADNEHLQGKLTPDQVLWWYWAAVFGVGLSATAIGIAGRAWAEIRLAESDGQPKHSGPTPPPKT